MIGVDDKGTLDMTSGLLGAGVGTTDGSALQNDLGFDIGNGFQHLDGNFRQVDLGAGDLIFGALLEGGHPDGLHEILLVAETDLFGTDGQGLCDPGLHLDVDSGQFLDVGGDPHVITVPARLHVRRDNDLEDGNLGVALVLVDDLDIEQTLAGLVGGYFQDRFVHGGEGDLLGQDGWDRF